MNTKLTLIMEQSLIEKTKKYAKENGRSLSDLIENYLKLIISEERNALIDSTPITTSMRGAFKATEEFDYKTELLKGLSKKYL